LLCYRTCFQFADTNRVGFITHMQLITLLNQLHPYDKQRTKRALAELDMSPGKVMTWKEFNEINGKLPTIFYPAFKLQLSMRVKVSILLYVNDELTHVFNYHLYLYSRCYKICQIIHFFIILNDVITICHL
jgi:hypothetical protein